MKMMFFKYIHYYLFCKMSDSLNYVLAAFSDDFFPDPLLNYGEHVYSLSSMFLPFVVS